MQDAGTQHRYTHIKKTMYDRGTQFPKLSGSAACVRAIGKPLQVIFEIYMDRKRLVDKQINLMLKRSVQLEEILHKNKDCYCWPKNVCDDFRTKTFEFLNLSSAIAEHFHTQKPPLKLFDVTIKFHILIHAALFAYGINPCVTWNYMGEDMMKKMKVLVQANTRGTKWLDVGDKVIDQYVQGMDFLLDPDERFFR
jgi:hypothetical protein